MELGMLYPTLQSQLRTMLPKSSSPMQLIDLKTLELFAKHQPGVAGCGWLQPGRNFLST